MARTRRKLAACATLAVVALASACSSKAEVSSSGSSGSGVAGSVKTGRGVTADTITLGAITDLSGVFAAQGRETVQGINLFWDKKNTEGGVCGRKVAVEVKDNNYNTQTAVNQYAEIKGKIAGIQTLLGSPQTAALLQDIRSDQMLTIPSSWAPSLLAETNIVVAGTPYDVDMMNAVQWLMDAKGLKKGDSIGHIYLEGEYGESALAGTRAAAKELDLKMVEQKIQPSDSDLTAQVTAIQRAGAKFIMLSGTGAQTSSAVSVAEAGGFDATFVGSNVTFVPSLLNGPAKAALEKRFFVVSSFAPFATTLPGVTKVRESYLAKNPGTSPTYGPVYGSGVAEIMFQILDKACKDGDLTPEGISKARASLSKVDTGGLIANLDFTKAGKAPAIQSYIAQPDGTQPGALKVVKDLFNAPFVKV